MPKRLIPEGQESHAIRELLESPVFPESLNGLDFFQVRTDDADGNQVIDMLTVEIAGDSDVHLHIINGGTCRFRTLAGGGKHLRVRQALLILAEAIRLDTEEEIPGAEVM